MTVAQSARGPELLTEKECEALEMVLRRLSSKEIGKQLGVSPKAVDQRLDNARAKLGASTRLNAATRYAEHKGIPGRLPYQPFLLTDPDPNPAQASGVSTDAVYTLADAVTFSPQLPWSQPHQSDAPEFWAKWALRLGTLPRLVLIIAGAVMLLIFASLGMSLSEGLTELIRG